MAPAEEKFTQDGRILNLQTPLGKDYFLIDTIDATEAISSLFTYVIKLRHAEDSITTPPTAVKPSDILGKGVAVTLVQPDGTTRHFHGMVNRFTQGGRDARFTAYRMEVVPQLWILTQSQQSRIFQNKSVKEILETVLNEKKIIFKDETQRLYQPKNYCVQYRESDFDFVSRMMEEEGIFYYFQHTPDEHTMIIADKPESHKPCPSKSSIEFVHENTSELDTPVVYEWSLDYQLQTGKIEFWDDKFQLPGKKLEAPKLSRFNDLGNGETEFFDYPGGYAKRFDGVDKGGGDQPANLQKVFSDSAQVAQSAVDALDAKYKTYRGMSDCSSFTAGHKIKIEKLPIKDDNREYALTSLTLHCDQSPDYTSTEELDGPIQNQFECIPLGDATFPPYRPQHVTPKPTVYGPITAVVVGPSGDEIFTDKYGRVKVQFHWDREGKNDAASSCWIRVCTSIAGNKWGTMFIPRVGQEVMVGFEHGDPDQPLIIGSVYNEKSMPHYELPKYETLSYIKTRTSPDDGKGFNELRFEDKKGKEQVFVHSQKRYDLRVKGSMYETCGGNRQEVIGYKVIVDGKEQSGGNLATTVGGNFDLHVGGDQFIGIDKGSYETVKSDVGEEYKTKQCSKVTAARELNARSITLEALTSVTLRVGPTSFIKVDNSGVTIQGPIVNINSGGAATPTSPFQMSDPMDAEHADTGEPGYLDRPRPSGGGGGSRWRTVDGYHAPAVQRNDDGSYQVQSVVVRGTPEYQQNVLADLAQISNTENGQQLLDDLEATGQTTTITEQTPPPNPPNAFAGPGNSTPADFQAATPAGQPVFDGAGNPMNDSAGNQLIGTGTGAPSNVGYNPDQWPDPTSDHNAPGDVILFHELQHSKNQQNGQFDGTPRTDGFTTNEEFNAIGPENEYRDERGVERRTNHGDL